MVAGGGGGSSYIFTGGSAGGLNSITPFVAICNATQISGNEFGRGRDGV
jgi:hypothetical protein